MASDEVRFAEAVAALTARLTQWGVEEPHDKAHTYVADMRKQGWRPNAPSVWTEPTPPRPVPPPADALAAARAELARIRAEQQAARQDKHDEPTKETA